MTDLDVVTVEPPAVTEIDRVFEAPVLRTPPPARTPPIDEEPDWETLAPTGWYARRGKRVLDLALLAVVLPIAVVPLLIVALVNLVAYRDPRKVLFTQERVGWQGRRFVIFKFRTMKDVPRGNMDSWREGKDQLRVMALGRLLRNTHLDELPQLLNVLLGNMQFIGPRPEMVEVEAWATENVPGFSHRLAIRPGITGLAQITQGYAACDPDAYGRKLSINLEYMRRISLRADAAIVLRTAIWVLLGRGSKWASPRCAPLIGIEPRRSIAAVRVAPGMADQSRFSEWKGIFKR